MTGPGTAAPATTPQGRKSAAPLPPTAANQSTRGPRFEGMEGMFRTAEEPPSDAAGTPVRHGRSHRQVCGFRARSRDGRWIEVQADSAVGPERDLQHPTRDLLRELHTKVNSGLEDQLV